RKPAVLLITEMVKHGATGDKISTDQDELLWQTFQDFYVAYEEGRLTASQVLPLALTWKGVSGTFGWAGIEGKLSPAIRGPFAFAAAEATTAPRCDCPKGTEPFRSCTRR